MSKKVVLVGHCGPDASYLRLAVTKAVRDVSLVHADDDASLSKALESGVDLVLVNRQLDWGFATNEGIELIGQLHAKFPDLKIMLVSNFADAQREAMSAGAVNGFGKRDLGTPRVAELLKSALGVT